MRERVFPPISELPPSSQNLDITPSEQSRTSSPGSLIFMETCFEELGAICKFCGSRVSFWGSKRPSIPYFRGLIFFGNFHQDILLCGSRFDFNLRLKLHQKSIQEENVYNSYYDDELGQD